MAGRGDAHATGPHEQDQTDTSNTVRRQSERAAGRYVDIKDRIKAIYARHKGRYGYRRITEALRKQGDVINHKTVQRLMGELQLKSIVD